MEWLTQNWMVVVFAVGSVLLMRRGGMSCGHAGGEHRKGAQGDGADASSASARHLAQTMDSVSGRAVDRHNAAGSFYRGAPIYFESRENRDRYEATPEQFPNGRSAAAPKRRRHC